MSADSVQWSQLGELLVEKGVLTDAQLQVALEEQQRSSAPLGEILVQLGFLIGPAVGNALAEQHGGPLRTEYGFALGVPSAQSVQANDRASGARPRAAEPTPEQDMAIARLTAALNERTQELERARSELGALERHKAERAIAAAELEILQSESVELREERTRAQQVLEDQLAQARVQRDDLADTQVAQAEPRRALEQRNGELTGVQSERTELANGAGERERELDLALSLENDSVRIQHMRELRDERALHADHADQRVERVEHARIEHEATVAAAQGQSALVAAAVARAQRRYGPPIRMASAEQEPGGGREEVRDLLEVDDRAGGTGFPEANPITIRPWQVALFIVLVPSLSYAVASITGMLVAAAVGLVFAVVVICGKRRLNGREERISRQPADGATTTPSIPHQS